MRRDHLRDREEYERRLRGADREDFGQADYSTDYRYDPQTRTGYRAGPDDYRQSERARAYGPQPEGHVRRDERDYPEPRSWGEMATDYFVGHPTGADPQHARPARRRGSSDRVLWAVIVERLEDERRLDLSDVEVLVDNGEVTLNGTVRRRDDKRRIEDVAEIDGVRHVQNNLRVRDRGGWGLF
jgi:hypothetical protein